MSGRFLFKPPSPPRKRLPNHRHNYHWNAGLGWFCVLNKFGHHLRFAWSGLFGHHAIFRAQITCIQEGGPLDAASRMQIKIARWRLGDSASVSQERAPLNLQRCKRKFKQKLRALNGRCSIIICLLFCLRHGDQLRHWPRSKSVNWVCFGYAKNRGPMLHFLVTEMQMRRISLVCNRIANQESTVTNVTHKNISSRHTRGPGDTDALLLFRNQLQRWRGPEFFNPSRWHSVATNCILR